MGDPQSPYGPTQYRMQVTILTSKEDVKRTRGLGCLTGGRPGSQRHSGEWCSWRGTENWARRFSERIKDQRRRASLRPAEAGRRMASRVGRLPAGSRRYGNTARKRFAVGPGCGIIRAHGFKRMFGKIGRKR